MTGKSVFEVTAENFQDAVVERSLQVPVLLDFWAEWCGPCRTLGPVLERLAEEYGGGFVLGKVDADREQDLAMAFRVQGIPFCILIHRGAPVDAFSGALREAEVRRFLLRHGIKPVPAEQPAAAAEAAPDSPEGRWQRARTAAAGGDAATALAVLEGFPEEDERFEQVARLRDALAFLQERLRPEAPGAEGLLARAQERFTAGDPVGAMDLILEAAEADKGFRQGLPRRAMVLCFLVLGEEDERCDSYRRRLATLLY